MIVFASEKYENKIIRDSQKTCAEKPVRRVGGGRVQFFRNADLIVVYKICISNSFQYERHSTILITSTTN